MWCTVDSKFSVGLSASVACGYWQMWRTVESNCGVRLTLSVAYG